MSQKSHAQIKKQWHLKSDGKVEKLRKSLLPVCVTTAHFLKPPAPQPRFLNQSLAAVTSYSEPKIHEQMIVYLL